MGQQQLLLLVLATVIVGLATVAGIQAFDENQEQATRDAMTQRGIDLATEIKAVANKPSQFGGMDWTASDLASEAASAANLNDGSPTDIPAEGAGNGATCDITSVGGSADDPTATILCGTSDDPASANTAMTINLESGGDITTDSGDNTSSN